MDDPILYTSAWKAKFPEGAVSSRGTTKTTDHGQVYYAKAEKNLVKGQLISKGLFDVIVSTINDFS